MKLKNLIDIKLYYLIIMSSNLWLTTGNWIFFWLKQMDIMQLGILNSITFGISLLCEIPSGIIADIFGTKITIIISRILAFCGILTMACATNMWVLFIGDTLFWIGNSFYSGAAEAHVYQSLAKHNLTEHYEAILTKGTSLMLLFTIIGSIIGSFLYIVNDKLPWLIFALSLFISIGASLMLSETKKIIIDKSVIRLKDFWQTFQTGSKELLNAKLRIFFWSFFALSSILFFFDEGFLKPYYSIKFGFDAFDTGIIFALINIVNILLLNLIAKLAFNLKSIWKVVILEVGLLLAFALANFGGGLIFGGIIIASINLINMLSKTWITNIISHNSSDQYKATTISTLAMLSKLPYSILALFAALLLSKDLIWLINLAICIFLVASLIQLIYRHRNESSKNNI
jgi:MFS family permease